MDGVAGPGIAEILEYSGNSRLCTAFEMRPVIGVIALAAARTTHCVRTQHAHIPGGCARLTADADLFHFISSLHSILGCNN